MADSNDSPGQRPAHDPSPAESPEIVDAEVVEYHRSDTARKPEATDDEEYRQYREFLEFRKFQEWQRLHGTDGTGTEAPPSGTPPPDRSTTSKRPGWKRALRRTLRLLRFKFVRRLLYLVLVLVLIYAGINYYFGTDNSGLSGSTTPDQLEQGRAALLPSEPRNTVDALYDSVVGEEDRADVEIACALFSTRSSPTAADQFGGHFGEADCPAAIRKLHGQVTAPDAYRHLDRGQGRVKRSGDKAVVSTCEGITGGPPLGNFVLSARGDGWIISGHESCET